jgi:hypothetical protein
MSGDVVWELPFCSQCGKPCPKGKCDACGMVGTFDDEGALVCMSLTAIVRCRFCGDSVPLPGPVPTFECGACRKTDSIDGAEWGEALATVARGWRRHGSRIEFERTRVAVPASQVSAVPRWLLDELPCARAIHVTASSDADQAARLRGTGQLVMMVCPRCGAGLEITQASERITRCRHCEVDVFLPAELWERFHPKQAATTWMLVYEAPIMTARESARGVEIRRTD